LNPAALSWLSNAREVAASAGLAKSPWHEISDNCCLLFTWSGSRTQRTIVLLAREAGIEAVDRDIAIEMRAPAPVARHKLLAAIRHGISADDLADQEPFQERRKYDCYLPKGLLRASFIGNALDVDGFRSLLEETCAT
ncbi:MAG: hypothetical protein WD971_06190, partial [Pirellulales bacterium]